MHGHRPVPVELPAEAGHGAGREAAVVERDFVPVFAAVPIKDSTRELPEGLLVAEEARKALADIAEAARLAEGIAEVGKAREPVIGPLALGTDAPHVAV